MNNKQNQKEIKNDEVSFKGIIIIFCCLFFFITIPFALAVLYFRQAIKIYAVKNKTKILDLHFLMMILLELITFGILGVSIYFLVDYQSLAETIGNKFLKIIALLFSISGVLFFGFNWYLITTSSYFFKRYQKRQAKIEERKKKHLSERKVSNVFYEKESHIKKFIMGYDVWEKNTNIIESFIKETINIDGTKLNNDCVIPDNVITKHVSIVGTTGFGKTTTAKHFIKRAIESNKRVVFVDGKADNGLKEELKDLAKNLDKKIIIYELNSNETLYNPFKNKTSNEIVSMLVESSGYSKTLVDEKESAYYKRAEKAALDFIVPKLLNFLNHENQKINKFDFNWLKKWSNVNFITKTLENAEPKDLVRLFPERWEQVKRIKEFKETYKNYQTEKAYLDDSQNIAFIKAKFEGVINDFKGKLNSIEQKIWDTLKFKMESYNNSLSNIQWNGFGLSDVFNGEFDADIVLFSIPTLSDPTNGSFLANIIIQDIKQCAKINQASNKVTLLFFDEFGSYGSTTLTELLLQGRSYKYAIFLIYQGIAELQKIQPNFQDNVVNNTNTLIVHGLSDPTSCEYFASIFGTEKTAIDTFQTGKDENNLKNLTGTGSVRVGDEFIFNPNEIRNLGIGKCIIRTLSDDENTKGERFIYKTIQKVDFI